MTDWEERLACVWIEQLREAYVLTRAQTRAELHGTRIDRYDQTGIHMFSRACGCAAMIQHLLRLDPEVFHWSPSLIRRCAYDDAYNEFKKEVLSAQGQED